MNKAIAYVICAAIVVGAQYLVLEAYTAWWDSATGGTAPVPESTVQFLTVVVSLGISLAILKVWPDEPS